MLYPQAKGIREGILLKPEEEKKTIKIMEQKSRKKTEPCSSDSKPGMKQITANVFTNVCLSTRLSFFSMTSHFFLDAKPFLCSACMYSLS